jgi:hypothetical protein
VFTGQNTTSAEVPAQITMCTESWLLLGLSCPPLHLGESHRFVMEPQRVAADRDVAAFD